VTTLIGGLATIIVSLLPPWRALLLTLLLTGGYLAVNGILVFDYGDRILGVAAPVTAAGLVWGGLTLARSISEAAERSRITKRFRSYVDPALVDYVIEHPEVRLDGQEKEMTVVFTDLAGFTTLSEALREKTVPLLNEYMGLMVPIIHANRGLRNKFLGDGIMFFFSAPRDNPRHARDAVATVLQMQDSMKRFNEGLAARGLPPVSMRAGISSGKMVVGDAGSLDDRFRANDYTVLGDVVNLGARLESANKATGTKMLLNDRARDLIDLEEFLVRPIGKLQVVGKTEGVMTFEPLCRRKEATEEQLKLAEMTTRVVDLFRDGQFQACMDAAIEMQLTFGEGKLARLYIELCNQYLVEPPTNGWDGQIVLFEK
jgi:adenylate cyclase